MKDCLYGSDIVDTKQLGSYQFEKLAVRNKVDAIPSLRDDLLRG